MELLFAKYDSFLGQTSGAWTAYLTLGYVVLTAVIACYARRAWKSSQDQLEELRLARRLSTRPIVVAVGFRALSTGPLVLELSNVGQGAAMKAEGLVWAFGAKAWQAGGRDFLEAKSEMANEPPWGWVNEESPIPPNGRRQSPVLEHNKSIVKQLPTDENRFYVFYRLKCWGVGGDSDVFDDVPPPGRLNLALVDRERE
jgi:hypothetical protein